jgi:hypothetical protein
MQFTNYFTLADWNSMITKRKLKTWLSLLLDDPSNEIPSKLKNNPTYKKTLLYPHTLPKDSLDYDSSVNFVDFE